MDKHGTVLYVGKAKDLKSRVKTYFNGGDGRRKIEQLVREAAKGCLYDRQTERAAFSWRTASYKS